MHVAFAAAVMSMAIFMYLQLVNLLVIHQLLTVTPDLTDSGIRELLHKMT